MANSRFEQYGKLSLPELLKVLDTDSEAGSDTYRFLQNVLLARSAEAVHDGLLGNAQTNAASAKFIGEKIDRLNKELGESKAIMETAGKRVSDALAQSSEQSSRLRLRLNWLTLALVFAAVVTAGATVFSRGKRRMPDLSPAA